MEKTSELQIRKEKTVDASLDPAIGRRLNFGKILYNLLLIICFAFVMVSVAVHLSLAAVLLDSLLGCETERNALLFVLPSFEKKEAYFEEERLEIESEITGESDFATEEDNTSEIKPSEAYEDEETVKEGVASLDLSCSGFALKNETAYNPDLEALFNSPEPIDKSYKLYERYLESSPLVLIYHTHATESYYDTNDSGSFRSPDLERNMIAVGRVLADKLNECGVSTLHITELFDLEAYSEAYQKSALAVEKIMKEYPSVQYLIDVHRDSVSDSSGQIVSADTVFEGKRLAQLMFVCGTDEGGSGHKAWRENLTFALQMQDMLQDKCESIMRPINLRRASFYQDKSAGALILEIGATGNTLDEAKNSAILFAESFAEYVMGKSYSISH